MLNEAWEFREEEKYLIEISAAPEWAVAAVLLTMRTLGHNLLTECIVAGWYQVPVEKWIEVIKPSLELVGRSLIAGNFAGPDVLKLRNLMNVTARSDEPADWGKEMRERRVEWAPKFAIWGEKPYDEYVSIARERMDVLAAEHVAAVANDRECEDAEMWWAARHHATPGGASTHRKECQDLLMADRQFRPQDRPKKKAVVELLPDEWFSDLLFRTPDTHCRCSTKNEPGMKNRPLHANNDSSYTVEAFALAHLEKAMDMQGASGKQMPVNVLEWMQVHDDSMRSGGSWLSVDYPNFCTFHSKRELAEASMARARAWARLNTTEVGLQKQLASYWMAVGHFNSNLKHQAGDFERCTSGLYSGARATLMDHNYLHPTYMEIGIRNAEFAGWTVDFRYKNWTGDDEDTMCRELHESAAYLWGMRFAGLTLNPWKQEAGALRPIDVVRGVAREFSGAAMTHTYLQRAALGDMVPLRPIARIVATLASGNWYVEPGLWFDSVIGSVSDNWWECVTRGMELRTAQLLARAFINRLMVVRPTLEDGPDVVVKKLGWWQFASAGDHPLWRGTSAGSEAPPSIPSKPEPARVWPNHATIAWMRRVRHIVKQLRPTRALEYYNYLQMESIGSAAHHYRQRSLRDGCRAIWPERIVELEAVTTRQLEAPIGARELVTLSRALTCNRRPVTEEEQLARIGIDAYLYKLCGAEVDLMKALDPVARGRWVALDVVKKNRERVEQLDSAIRAWSSSVHAECDALHVWRESKASVVRRKLVVCFIPNAGGKTWLCQRARSLIDMDVAVYARVGWVRYSRQNVGAFSEWLASYQAAVDAYDGDVSAAMIMTQWPADGFCELAALQDRQLELRVLDVPLQTRVERLVARGWSQEKVEERLERAHWALETYETKGIARRYRVAEEILEHLYGWSREQ